MNFAVKFRELRKANGLTLDKTAELFNVSRQTIQKWEAGKALPEMQRLEAISRELNISLDYLIMGDDRRSVEEKRTSDKFYPEYNSVHVWESYQAELLQEYRQSFDEGRDVEKYRELIAETAKLDRGECKEKIGDAIFSLVMQAPMRADYKYVEPDTYQEICRLRNGASFDMTLPTDEEMKGKLLGALYGRICGCMLGKPVEGWKRDKILVKIKEQDNYPLQRYIAPEMFSNGCAVSDDDTNYTVMSSLLIEKYGAEFTSKNVADLWLARQPKDAYCTAERVAYRNFLLGYTPPYSAIYKNPYREWIGAQIRTDWYGYINPCNPEAAAEMAFRDASISHVKNGIYGAMFVSAMLACAAGCDDIKAIISCGLSQIPHSSRLYEHISAVISDYENGGTAEKAFAKINSEWNEYNGNDWCHTISNACIVAVCLLYGGGDYTRSVCMAVEEGFDTDCNGATVGSVLGMRSGIASIDEKWTKPLCGTLDTSICGMSKVSIDSLAEKALKQTSQLGYKLQ